MPDLVVRNIDHLLAERIQSLAKARQWSVNDVLLHALRRGLGVAENGAQVETELDVEGLVLHTGLWDPAEQAAFEEAVQALSRVRKDTLVALLGGPALYG